MTIGRRLFAGALFVCDGDVVRVLIVLGSRAFEEMWTHVVVSEVDDVEVRSCSTAALDRVLASFAPDLVVVPDELHGPQSGALRARGLAVVEVGRDEAYDVARERVMAGLYPRTG